LADRSDRELLRSLGFFVVPAQDGVVLKRGTTEVAVSGTGAAAAVEELVRVVGHGSTRDDIFSQFEQEDRPAIGALIDSLLASRLFQSGSANDLPDGDEGNVDVWYWQFEQTRAERIRALGAVSTVLVGNNSITRRLAQTLVAAGAPSPCLVDDPQLNFASLSETESASKGELFRLVARDAWLNEQNAQKQLVVAASEFGNLKALLDWNRICVERDHFFLPILLQNSIGYVGPLVFPGETACLDCVRARWNAGVEGTHSRQAVEEVPPEAQRFIGFHPAMPSLLAELGALELTKFFGSGLPFRRAGVQIEVQMLMPRMTTRSILKVPRCPSCSPLRTRVSGSARRS
jgi:bacteriocin biosynthesis cyclodehydratase domain-containing protein